MANPAVASTAETAVTTAGTSHLLTMPASIVATDLVLVTMDIGSTSATVNALANWTEILDESSANGLKIMWWTGAGAATAPTFVTSGSTRSASIVWRITGADLTITPTIGTTSTGTSANPDPPVSATMVGAKDCLVIAIVGMAGEEADDDTWGNTPPTNYLPNPPLQIACGTAGASLGGLLVAASRQVTIADGATENPGTFNVDVSAAYRAQTITVHQYLVKLNAASAVVSTTLAVTAQTTVTLAAASATATTTLALTAPAIFGIRRNIVKNPSIEVDTTEWAQFQGTGSFARVTTDSVFGSACLKQTNPGSGVYEGAKYELGGALTIGRTYSVAVYVKSTAGKHIMVDFDNSSFAPTQIVATGAWQRVTYTSTATTATLDLRVLNDGSFGAEAADIYIDAAQCIEEPSASPYFDGSFPGASWEGSANASTSDYGSLVVFGQSSATLAITIPAPVTLGASNAVASATLALTAQTTIALSAASATASATLVFLPYFTPTASGQSSATLALTAPTQVSLVAASGVATTTLALTAKTTVALDPASGVASTTLALSAKTTIALGTSAAVSSTSLALNAPTTVVLGASSAVSTTTLVISAQTGVSLGASTAVSTTTLVLNAPTIIALSSSLAVSSTILALTAKTAVPLGSADAVSSTDSLNLYVPGGAVQVPLADSNALSSATLALTARTYVGLGASGGSSTTSLTLTITPQLPLVTATGSSSAVLTFTVPTGVPLEAAVAAVTALLRLSAQTGIPLDPANVLATTSLTNFFGGTLVFLNPANGLSSAVLHIRPGEEWGVATDVPWTQTPGDEWVETDGSDWSEVDGDEWQPSSDVEWVL